MAEKDEFPISGVRFRGGRTLHNIRRPKDGQWAGTLEAACGKTGQQSFGFSNRPASQCHRCAAALATGEWWWMVGCDGSLPHFYAATSSRSAVSEFRANLIDMERGTGVSIRDARFIVFGLDPHVIAGPFTTAEAYVLDTGWTWATKWADTRDGVIPSDPFDRATAVQRLGEEVTARLESAACARYGISQTRS